MAASDLRAELDCSICLSVYTDPVMLPCGHNYCRACIDGVLDTQGAPGGFSCPQCREEFHERPALHRNLLLYNLTQHFQSFQSSETGASCTYCIHASVPAEKFCLHCEASLCGNHLIVHSKSPEHVLCDPSTSLDTRKCPVHKKILEYYCAQDSTCICVSCSITGDHHGHRVATLQEASLQRKKRLINNLQNLTLMKEKIGERVKSLQAHMEKVQGKADGETERVSGVFRELRRRLEDLERRILRDISGKAKQVVSPLSDLIRKLDIEKDEVSRKMRRIEELCNIMDPLTVLQESDTPDLCGEEGGSNKGGDDKLLRADLDLSDISCTLRTGLADTITSVNGGIFIQKAVDILWDVDTAANDVCISYDRKTASRSGRQESRPDNFTRFDTYPQVLSGRSFSSGRWYWEVDVHRSNNWRIGMCHPSMDREGDDSLIGCNDVSWALDRRGKDYMVIHDNDESDIVIPILCDRVRVYLDYEAGQISFYMGDPFWHLHTFTSTFTEPLHASVGVWHSHISLLQG